VRDELRVHRAEADDAPAIAAVLSAAFAEHRAQYTPAAYAATIPDRATISARLADGPVWVAVRGGDVIGTISAVRVGATLRLRGVAVVPSARGTGVGDLLLNRATEWASPTGFDRESRRWPHQVVDPQPATSNPTTSRDAPSATGR
jgi:GNAT superfamily N-acetyltransferase